MAGFFGRKILLPAVLLLLATALLFAGSIAFLKPPIFPMGEWSYTLSSDTIKNGDTLEVTATGSGGILLYPRFTARIEETGVTFPLIKTGTQEWKGEWVGEGLETKSYTVSVEVRDVFGRTEKKTGATFTDPLFGITTPGTTTYPNGFLTRLDKLIFDGTARFISSDKDLTNGYMYFGTNTAPGMIVKVRMSDFTVAGRVIFNSGENYVWSTRVDPTTGFGYAGLNVSPGKVVKFDLNTMTRVGVVTLNAGENNIRWGQIDQTNQNLYVSVDTTPAKVVKLNLNTFARDSVLTLNAGENTPSSAVIDVPREKLYLGLKTDKIVKIDLSGGVMTRLAVLDSTSTPPIPAGLGQFSNAVMDNDRNYAYFGTDNNPGKIYKVEINPGFVIDEVFDLQVGETGMPSLFWDQDTSSAYAVTSQDPGKVIQVVVGPTMSRGDEVTLNTGEDDAFAGQYDPIGKDMYLGTSPNPSEIVKVHIETTPVVDLQRVGALPIVPLSFETHDAAMELDGSFGYFFTSDNTGVLAKVALPAMQFVSAVALSDNADTDTSGFALDAVHDYIYLGVDGDIPTANEDYIEQIDTNTMTVTNRIMLGADHFLLPGKGLADSAGNYAYFGTCESSVTSKVIKLDINPSSGTYLQVVGNTGGLDPVISGTCMRSMALDETDGPGYIYVGQRSSPGKIHKIDRTTMTKVGTITLPAGENNVNTLMLDAANDRLYAGLNTNPGRIIQIDTALFTRLGAITLNAGETQIYSHGLDAVRGYGYFITSGTPVSKVIRIALSSFTRDGMLSLPTGEDLVFRALYDPSRGYLYAASDHTPVDLVRVAVAHKGQVLATKVTLSELANTVSSLRFYSHAATGNLRFALYDASLNKLWESGVVANTASADWLRVAVSSGTPTTLSALPAGDYWLAFQTDSFASVASYALGASGAGRFLAQDFGAFPASLSASQTSTDTFALHAVYNVSATVTPTLGSTDVEEGGASDTYDVVLTSQPTSDVVITPTFPLGMVGSPASLTFTSLNWNTPQTVTVSFPVDGVVQGGTRTETITHGIATLDPDFSSITVPSHGVQVTDHNTPNAPTGLQLNYASNGAGTLYPAPGINFEEIAPYALSFLYTDGDTSDTAPSYRVQIATDTGFTAIVFDTLLSNFSSPVTQGDRTRDILLNGFVPTRGVPYYLRAQVTDAFGLTSGDSSTYTFSVMEEDDLTPPLVSAPVAETPSSPGAGGGSGSGGPLTGLSGLVQQLLHQAAPEVETGSTVTGSGGGAGSAYDGGTGYDGRSVYATDAATTVCAASGRCMDIPELYRTYLLSCLQENLPAPVFAYTDLSQDAQIEKYVLGLAQFGVLLEPRADGSFGADTYVTRSEILRYALAESCTPVRETFYTQGESPFPDVPLTHPDYFFIFISKLASVVQGYLHDGQYHPDQYATRAEALKIVLGRSFTQRGEKPALVRTENLPFGDVDQKEWYRPYVEHGYLKGVAQGDLKGNFSPNAPITRRDLILMFGRAFLLPQN